MIVAINNAKDSLHVMKIDKREDTWRKAKPLYVEDMSMMKPAIVFVGKSHHKIVVPWCW